MLQTTTVEAAVCAADFLAQQQEAFELLWRQYSLNIEAYPNSQAYRIDCYGDANIIALVEGIRGRLRIPNGWRVDII